MLGKDAVWLITGCSRGLGREIAKAVLQRGWRVAVTARDPGTVADLVAGHEDRAVALPLDVTRQGQPEAALATTLERFGRIDVLVNNAGYGLLGAVEEIEEEDARRQFDTNFFGPVALIRAALPHMRAQRSGHIVNVSSVGGFCAMPSCGQYSATKFALEGLSEALAQELAPLGVHVTVVEPNGFRTDFLSQRSAQRAGNSIADYAATAGAQIGRFDEIEGKQPSDPVRGAAAIITAVEAEAPPFRLTLGPSGVKRIREKLASVAAELTRWEELSASVSFPDV